MGTQLFPHQPLQFPHLPWTSSTGRRPTALGKRTRAMTQPPSPYVMVASHSFSPRSGFHRKQQAVHVLGEVQEQRGSVLRPRGAGMGQRHHGPTAELMGFPLVWDSRAVTWRWWKLKRHRNQPSKGPCRTAKCRALPDLPCFIPE